jgi:hypothetical protein
VSLRWVAGVGRRKLAPLLFSKWHETNLLKKMDSTFGRAKKDVLTIPEYGSVEGYFTASVSEDATNEGAPYELSIINLDMRR